MDNLPKDPAILVSSVRSALPLGSSKNMLLRDEEFDSLESLCYAFSREPKEIKDYLREHNIGCLLFGGQISRSFRFMEKAVSHELSDMAGLTITTVSDFSNAAFKGLVAMLHEQIK